jgi:hypothetical protein
MKSNNERAQNDGMSSAGAEPDLVRRTLRTVALLVAGCVLFVGALSVIAVAVTSRALNREGAGEPQAREANEPSKKPLSI